MVRSRLQHLLECPLMSGVERLDNAATKISDEMGVKAILKTGASTDRIIALAWKGS
jgi:hypothetical protein